MTLKNCKTVTTMSCVNQFFSFLSLVGCSDRSVRVYDLNQGRVVREGGIQIPYEVLNALKKRTKNAPKKATNELKALPVQKAEYT